mgnify:CR=1 FL=1
MIPLFDRSATAEVFDPRNPAALAVFYAHAHLMGCLERAAAYVWAQVRPYEIAEIIRLLRSWGVRVMTPFEAGLLQTYEFAVPAVDLFKFSISSFCAERGLVRMPARRLFELAHTIYIKTVQRLVKEAGEAVREIANNNPHGAAWAAAAGCRAREVRGTPPCMEAILEALKNGENLPHTARFAITTYLLWRGWDVDQIVDLFRTAPDFNEKITRYQVQHIAGQTGGRKQYAVPSCRTMSAWGLCPAKCGVKSPARFK